MDKHRGKTNKVTRKPNKRATGEEHICMVHIFMVSEPYILYKNSLKLEHRFKT